MLMPSTGYIRASPTPTVMDVAHPRELRALVGSFEIDLHPKGVEDLLDMLEDMLTELDERSGLKSFDVKLRDTLFAFRGFVRIAQDLFIESDALKQRITNTMAPLIQKANAMSDVPASPPTDPSVATIEHDDRYSMQPIASHSPTPKTKMNSRQRRRRAWKLKAKQNRERQRSRISIEVSDAGFLRVSEE
jgi:hypothetical protein